MREVQIKARQAFDVNIGGVALAPFFIVEEWRDLLRLKNEIGWEIVMTKPTTMVEGPLAAAPRILTCSPEIAAMLHAEEGVPA